MGAKIKKKAIILLIAILFLFSCSGGKSTTSGAFANPDESAIYYEGGVEYIAFHDRNGIYVADTSSDLVEYSIPSSERCLLSSDGSRLISVCEDEAGWTLRLYAHPLSPVAEYALPSSFAWVSHVLSNGSSVLVAGYNEDLTGMVVLEREGTFYDPVTLTYIDGITSGGNFYVLSEGGDIYEISPTSQPRKVPLPSGEDEVNAMCNCGGYICTISGKTLRKYSRSFVELSEGSLPEAGEKCGHVPDYTDFLDAEPPELIYVLSAEGKLYFFKLESLCEYSKPFISNVEITDNGEDNAYAVELKSTDECTLNTDTWTIAYNALHPSLKGVQVDVQGNSLKDLSFNPISEGLLAGDNVYINGSWFNIEAVDQSTLTIDPQPSFSGSFTATFKLTGFAVWGLYSGVQKKRLQPGIPFKTDDGGAEFLLQMQGSPDDGDSVKFVLYKRDSRLPITFNSSPYKIIFSNESAQIFVTLPEEGSVVKILISGTLERTPLSK